MWKIFPAPAKFAGSLGYNTDQAEIAVADENKKTNTKEINFQKLFDLILGLLVCGL